MLNENIILKYKIFNNVCVYIFIIKKLIYNNVYFKLQRREIR